MKNAILDSLSVVGVSGLTIILAIVVCLIAAVLATFVLRARYAAMAKELSAARGARLEYFSHPVLTRIARETKEALRHEGRELNTQVIIEGAFTAELKGPLTTERFIRSTPGLTITLGLIGTFYGLTLSIGKLVALVAAEETVVDITQTVIRGLTEALSGMAVAFTTSLFGVAAAIVMTLLGIFANVADRRTFLMIDVEHYLESLIQANAELPAGGGGGLLGPGAERSERALGAFNDAISRLEGAVAQFQRALEGFATTTRDFREFNLHLKDNIQRMSLGFGDLSETLKAHSSSLKGR